MATAIATKRCTVCGVVRPLTDFSKHRGRRDGLASRCKACNAAHCLAWYCRKQRETDGLYSTYVAMKGRCHAPSHDHFALYGGRGITVCAEWRDSFDSFREWANGNGYARGLQIDRIDNDKGYCPENCRFVTAAQNCRNKRARTRTIRTYTKLDTSRVREVRHLLADGLSQRVIAQRMRVSPSAVGAIKAGRTWRDVA